jgi:hypothetical protein
MNLSKKIGHNLSNLLLFPLNRLEKRERNRKLEKIKPSDSRSKRSLILLMLSPKPKYVKQKQQNTLLKFLHSTISALKKFNFRCIFSQNSKTTKLPEKNL